MPRGRSGGRGVLPRYMMRIQQVGDAPGFCAVMISICSSKRRNGVCSAISMPVMTEPMIWGNWPLVAESSNDSSLMPDSFPTHGLADNQTGMDEGEDGSKRRAACDECRMRSMVEQR